MLLVGKIKDCFYIKRYAADEAIYKITEDELVNFKNDLVSFVEKHVYANSADTIKPCTFIDNLMKMKPDETKTLAGKDLQEFLMSLALSGQDVPEFVTWNGVLENSIYIDKVGEPSCEDIPNTRRIIGRVAGRYLYAQIV